MQRVQRDNPAGEVKDTDGGAGTLLLLGTTMSAINGDKARFHRERKGKLARRERSKAIRAKLAPPAPVKPTGAQL